MLLHMESALLHPLTWTLGDYSLALFAFYLVGLAVIWSDWTTRQLNDYYRWKRRRDRRLRRRF